MCVYIHCTRQIDDRADHAQRQRLRQHIALRVDELRQEGHEPEDRLRDCRTRSSARRRTRRAPPRSPAPAAPDRPAACAWNERIDRQHADQRQVPRPRPFQDEERQLPTSRSARQGPAPSARNRRRWRPGCQSPAIMPARCPRSAACDMMNMTFGPGARLTSVVSTMNNRKLSGIIDSIPALGRSRQGCRRTRRCSVKPLTPVRRPHPAAPPAPGRDAAAR